jgi:MerR family copper efflux transcriptional regulator
MAYTIGEIARRADINISTLRFYERRGLLPEPPRNVYGHRVYDSGEVSRLRFIKRAQCLGFTLAEIKELLKLRESPATNCDRIRDRALEQLEATEQRIQDLMGVRESLAEMVEACDRRNGSSECPAVTQLEM